MNLVRLPRIKRHASELKFFYWSIGDYSVVSTKHFYSTCSSGSKILINDRFSLLSRIKGEGGMTLARGEDTKKKGHSRRKSRGVCMCGRDRQAGEERIDDMRRCAG